MNNKHTRKRLVHLLSDLYKALNEKNSIRITATLAHLDAYPEHQNALKDILSEYATSKTEGLHRLKCLSKMLTSEEYKRSQINRAIDEDTKTTIITEVKEKRLTLSAIAQKHGISDATLRHIRHEAGLLISTKCKHRQTFTDEQLKAAMLKANNRRDIAMLLGANREAVGHRIRFL
ncbi:hypothetical protein [Enterobacter hormaechei]|uniref:hypothetical protein n=1 Tax=Enterobacter hormaechei TaxID=158836 RepID=UPI0005ECFB98|nr:hypothetical protein [Enterobacter hormaechei]KJM78915.1 hypothetical protein SS12_15765 [Enterobacter hormaechei subsp. hoffmannii]